MPYEPRFPEGVCRMCGRKRRGLCAGCRRRRDALFTKWQYLAHWAVGRFWPHGLPSRLGRLGGSQAALQEGLVIVARCAERYDPAFLVGGKPVQFNTYCARSLFHGLSDWAGRKARSDGGSNSGRGAPGRNARAYTNADLPDAAAPAGADPLELAEVRAALARLDPRSRAVLRRRFWGGETLTGIGERFGLSKERVRQIQRDALRALRRQLEGAAA